MNREQAIKNAPHKTVAGQVRGIMGAQLLCGFLEFMVGAVILGGLYDYKVWYTIVAVLLLLVYLWVMFMQGYDTAIYDGRSSNPLRQYPWKGAALGAAVGVVSALLYALFKLPWITAFVNTGDLQPLWQLLEDFLFVVWSFPFNFILAPSNGSVSIIGLILVFAAPILFAGVGYWIGYKKIDIFSKMSFMMYEKKK